MPLTKQMNVHPKPRLRCATHYVICLTQVVGKAVVCWRRWHSFRNPTRDTIRSNKCIVGTLQTETPIRVLTDLFDTNACDASGTSAEVTKASVRYTLSNAPSIIIFYIFLHQSKTNGGNIFVTEYPHECSERILKQIIPIASTHRSSSNRQPIGLIPVQHRNLTLKTSFNTF